VIRHIVKKDLRLLWPLITVVATVHVGNAALLSSGGQFAPGLDSVSGDFGWISNVALPFIGLLGIVVLVIAVIQQDRLPGTTQDWLTRPIPRLQLLAAKLLLIVLSGLVPILLCDIAMGVIEHLRPHDVIAASLSRTVALFCLICLPAVLVAIVTRSLTEALLLGLAVVVVFLVEIIALTQLRLELPLFQSGFAWTISLVLLVANVLAVTLMLPYQFRWRSTNRMRWIALAYLCVCPAVLLLPWSVGFGLQRAMTDPPDGPPPAVMIDTTRPVTFVAYSSPGPRRPDNGNQRVVHLSVPVTVSTPRGDDRLHLDHGRAQLINPANGSSLDLAVVPFLDSRTRTNNPAQQILRMQVPFEMFQSARDDHAVIRATLFLTRFRLSSRKQVSSLDGGGVDPFSRCGWASGQVMSCISTRPVGTCTTLEERSDPHGRAKEYSLCRESPYAPWPLPVWRDPYYTHRFGGITWAGPIAAAGDGVLSSYTPDDHIFRNLEFRIDAAVEARSESGGSVDGLGTSARFRDPTEMIADSHGNLFVVDTSDSVVRKMSLSGEVTTYAGRKGETGKNDGQRDEARFDRPAGIAVDKADNLYIADTGNALIRRISPAGEVITVAGRTSSPSDAGRNAGLTRPTGIVCGPDGTLYVIDRNDDGSASIRKVLPNGAVATIAGPESVANPSNLIEEGGPDIY
jgi:hypothetical protein